MPTYIPDFKTAVRHVCPPPPHTHTHSPQVPTYIPDFKTAFEHVCIHPGGRGVIDEIAKQLLLTQAQVEPSRASLFRYGNTSSSAVW